MAGSFAEARAQILSLQPATLRAKAGEVRRFGSASISAGTTLRASADRLGAQRGAPYQAYRERVSPTAGWLADLGRPTADTGAAHRGCGRGRRARADGAGAAGGGAGPVRGQSQHDGRGAGRRGGAGPRGAERGHRRGHLWPTRASCRRRRPRRRSSRPVRGLRNVGGFRDGARRCVWAVPRPGWPPGCRTAARQRGSTGVGRRCGRRRRGRRGRRRTRPDLRPVRRVRAGPDHRQPHRSRHRPPGRRQRPVPRPDHGGAVRTGLAVRVTARRPRRRGEPGRGPAGRGPGRARGGARRAGSGRRGRRRRFLRRGGAGFVPGGALPFLGAGGAAVGAGFGTAAGRGRGGSGSFAALYGGVVPPSLAGNNPAAAQLRQQAATNLSTMAGTAQRYTAIASGQAAPGAYLPPMAGVEPGWPAAVEVPRAVAAGPARGSPSPPSVWGAVGGGGSRPDRRRTPSRPTAEVEDDSVWSAGTTAPRSLDAC